MRNWTTNNIPDMTTSAAEVPLLAFISLTIRRAPWVLTSMRVVRHMLGMAGVEPDDVFYDLSEVDVVTCSLLPSTRV